MIPLTPIKSFWVTFSQKGTRLLGFLFVNLMSMGIKILAFFV
jgi:hypothetical protein